MRNVLQQLAHVGEWLPAIKWHCLALMINMYNVSFFAAIPFYIYNSSFPDGGKISIAMPGDVDYDTLQ